MQHNRRSTMHLLEGVHPLQSGIFRLRRPDERRPGLPRENPLFFRIRLGSDLIRKAWFTLATLTRLSFAAIRINSDPKRLEYTDEAMGRVTDDDELNLDLLNQTPGAKEAVAHHKKVFELTHGKAWTGRLYCRHFHSYTCAMLPFLSSSARPWGQKQRMSISGPRLLGRRNSQLAIWRSSSRYGQGRRRSFVPRRWTGRCWRKAAGHTQTAPRGR